MTATAARAVVIGASAGALEALSAILPALPADFALPIFIVVHIPPDKQSVLATLFQASSPIMVREAEDKEPIRGGTAYFAPPDYHLLVEADGHLSLSSDELVLYSRPSIDVLFESASDAYGPGLIGVILSGANEDGAAGLRAVVDAGGTAVVQNPDKAFAPAMPEAAKAACPEANVLSLQDIAAYLQRIACRP
ncbi:MAG: chemotaxis protein CheB [Proteobacteria bacterium]|nr:chemotaxis protein CheB [Pseudomonadota bacterium]